VALSLTTDKLKVDLTKPNLKGAFFVRLSSSYVAANATESVDIIGYYPKVNDELWLIDTNKDLYNLSAFQTGSSA
jgi:hypothetical protein